MADILCRLGLFISYRFFIRCFSHPRSLRVSPVARLFLANKTKKPSRGRPSDDSRAIAHPYSALWLRPKRSCNQCMSGCYRARPNVRFESHNRSFRNRSFRELNPSKIVFANFRLAERVHALPKYRRTANTAALSIHRCSRWLSLDFL